MSALPTPPSPSPVDGNARERRSPRHWVRLLLGALNRFRLPTPSVLPIAGAVVGLYGGLAAGLFTNLTALVTGICLRIPHLTSSFRASPEFWQQLKQTMANASWHFEYAIIGVPVSLAALAAARLLGPGGGHEVTKQRLRVLGLLVLGALSLYYPLVALAALNNLFGHPPDFVGSLAALPWWLFLLTPTLGGLAVGRLLRDRPETHGHGVPEVVLAVKRQEEGLPARSGVLKMIASALTIGSGGSAGREGPIVYVGASFAAAAGRTLGFSRKELSILMACGAGAGIAASFNAPVAGAMFAMEIILREFELNVFSPVILASVTATMVSRGAMGSAPMLRRVAYEMISGWEILGYVALGLLCGCIAFVFIRLLHRVEDFFAGRFQGKLSRWLGQRSTTVRAGTGALLAGAMALANPAVWGNGHDYANLALVGQLSFSFLVLALVFKLFATTLTIGSGGSGGTFFPIIVMGAMAGGGLGEIIHALWPTHTAASGAYATVGMGGAAAALTRGPLTGMLMIYELSGNYAVILPLMVTCTIASALCHHLVERNAPRIPKDADILRQTSVGSVMTPASPIGASTPFRTVLELLSNAHDAVLPVCEEGGRVYGIAEFDRFRAVWRDEGLVDMLVASDIARRTSLLTAESNLESALRIMNEEDLDALPVVAEGQPVACGIVTRRSIRHYLMSEQAKWHSDGTVPMAPTEL